MLAKLENQVKTGKVLPGDPWLTDYKRWQEDSKEAQERWRQQVGAKEIPASTPPPKATPPPGELTGDALLLYECRYRGIAKSCCKLKKESASKGKRAQCPGDVPSLLDDLQAYVPYMYKKILGKGSAYRNPRGEKLAEAVELLYQYGCKRIDRLLPGFTKIVMKRISPEIDVVGDWTADIDAEALANPLKKRSSTDKIEEYKPPPKPEYVEICTVIHKQLEATLRKDLQLIVAQSGGIGQQGQPKSAELICPVSDFSCQKRSNRAPARVARGGTQRPNARQPQRSVRPGQRWRGRPSTARRMPRGGIRAKGLPPRLPPRRRKAVRAQASKELFDDLGRYREELAGETFNDIVKRLLSFYRKAGSARRFARATAQIGADKVIQLASKAPVKAQGELKYHTKPDTVKTRNHRGLLRREVEQWTYGYEYERLSDFLKDVHKASSKSKDLVVHYTKVEAAELKAFWDSCLEIYHICEDPRTPKERDACIACAERAVREECIDGTESTTKGGKRTERCAGGHRMVVGYAGLASGKSIKQGAAQAKREQIKALTDFFYSRQWCVIDYEPHYRMLGGYPRMGPGFPPPGAFQILEQKAKEGKTEEFGALWSAWALRDCFWCSKHNEWHTKHAHCTMDCGGNNGIFKGPCFEGCKGGFDISRWVDTGIKRLLGKKLPEGHHFKASFHSEQHELHIGGSKDQGSQATGAFKGQVHQKVSVGDGRNTFLNWLAMQVIADATNSNFHGGYNVFDPNSYESSVVRNVISGKFLPKETDPQKGITNDGLRYLNQLPITSWQRCYLRSPASATDRNKKREAEKRTEERIRACAKDAKSIQANANWRNSRLFEMVFAEVPEVKRYMSQYTKYWKATCQKKETAQEYFWFVPIPFTKRTQPAYNCTQKTNETYLVTMKHFKLGGLEDETKKLPGAGDAVASAAEPVVGKLLGMLLKAAGMYEMMKTLAKAAGLTPEQSADCEDEEYRHDILKITHCKEGAECQDTKRGCLLKVFAKNFGTVLESIIVMLGNKLVDWGVDMLRTLLEPLRSGLVAAAGSVPFAGGILAAAVNIAWELLMNFAAKALLKGFVIAKLPEWLHIKELANKVMDELMKIPIVQVIAGIILQLIDAAMVHGEKSWMAVGVDTAIRVIEVALQRVKPTPYFWLRALHFAKKEMARKATTDGSIWNQLRGLAQAMIGGFGAAVGRGITDEAAREKFMAAVDEIKGLLDEGGLQKLMEAFQSGPLDFLTNLIAKKIGPLVMPIVTTFVPMDGWVKGMLLRLGGAIAETVDEIQKKKLDGKVLIQRIIHVFEPKDEGDCQKKVFCRLFAQLPVDEPLKKLLTNGFTKLVDLLRDYDQIPGYLSKPWQIVSGVVDLVGGFLRDKIEVLLAGLGPEKMLVTGGIDALITILTDEKERAALFGPRPAAAILAKVAQVVKPWAKVRLTALAEEVGLQDAVGQAVEFLLGPQGPFVAGEAFFRNLPNLLKEKGQAAIAGVADLASGLLRKAMGPGAGGGVLGALVKGVLGMIGNALKSPGGLAAMFKNPSGILKSVTDLVSDFLKKAPQLITDPKLAPEKDLLAGAVDLVLKVLADSKARRQLFSSKMALLSRVAALAKPYLIRRLVSIAKPMGLEEPVKAAIELIMGPTGPFATGPTFFKGLSELLRNKGEIAMAEITRIAAGLIHKGMGALGKGPLAAVVKGILDRLAGAMKAPGGIAKALGDPVNLLKAAKDALRPLLDSLLGGVAANAQTGPAQTLLRSVLDGVTRLFDNPRQLIAQGVGALKTLAAKVAAGLKGLLASLVEKGIPDAGLRGLIGKAVDGFFGLVADPSKLAGLTGAKVLDLLKSAGAELFGYLKGKALALVRGAQLGPLAAASQGIVSGILTALEEVVGDPGRLKAVVEGGAAGLVSVAGKAIGSALSQLVQSAVPASLKATLKGVIDKVAVLFSSPAEIGKLARTSVQGLLADVAPFLKQVLEGIFKSVAPPDLTAKVGAALEKVRSVLANPGALLQQAGEAARKAIDETLAALVLRIPDPALRDLAANLIALVRDLVTSGGAGDKLRSNLQAVLGRLVRGGIDYLVRLIPAGPIQTIVRQTLEGLRSLVSHPQGLAAALAQKASALLPRLVVVLQNLLRELASRILPDPAFASVVSGLAGELMQLIGNPSRWQALLRQGAGFLLSRALPVVRDLLMAAIGRASGLGDQVKSVITGLLEEAGRLFSNPAALASFAKNAVSSLVSMGVGAIAPLLTDRVREVGSPALSGLVRRAMAGVAELIQDPTKLQKFVRQKPGVIAGKILGEVKALVGRLAQTRIPDPALQEVASKGLGMVFDFVEKAIAGGANMGSMVKDSVAKVIPVVGNLIKEKLLQLFPGHLASLREVVARAFDSLVGLGSGLLSRGQAAWAAFSAGGPSAIFGRLMGGLLPLVIGPVVRAIPDPKLQAAVSKMLGSMTGLIGGTSGKSGKDVFAMFLGQARQLLTSLAKAYIEDPTLGRLASEGLKSVLDFVQHSAQGGDVGASVKAILAKLIPAVAELLKKKLVDGVPKGQRALKMLVTKGFDKMTAIATSIITGGRTAWQKLTTGGRKLLGDVVGELVGLLKKPLERAIRHRGLRALVTGLVEMLPRLLANATVLRGGRAAAGVVLGELGEIVEKFLDRTIVRALPPGLAQQVVGGVLHEGISLLKDPSQLTRFLGRVKSGKGLVKEIISGLAEKLKGLIKGGVGDIIGKGLNMLVEAAIK